jgi:hypothetical protein
MSLTYDDGPSHLTYTEWENLVDVLEVGLRRVVQVHPLGFEGAADDILDVLTDITSDVIPEWT